MSAADAHLLAQAAVGDDARAFALLAELSEALAVSLDLRRNLPIAIQRIVDYMQVEAASLFLYDEQAEELECKVCVGPVDVRGLRLTPDQGIVGVTFGTATVQLVADASVDYCRYESYDLMFIQLEDMLLRCHS